MTRRSIWPATKCNAMPTKDERAKHIAEWVTVFGARERATIQPHEIQAALDRMRSRMEPATVNKRRTALMDLWTVLDGRHQANPVKATQPYKEPTPAPRAPALVDVLRIIDAMPISRDFSRKCKARIKVIAWTGWPHAVLKALTPAHLDLKHARAMTPPRFKGQGSESRWLPLLPQAVAALKEFHKEDAYCTGVDAEGKPRKPFSNSSLHKRFATARDACKLPQVRPYDFRHFFGTLIATITRDERAVQELMLLKTVEMARRYTKAATDPRVQVAVADVAKQVPGLIRAAVRVSRVSRAGGVPKGPERAGRRSQTA
jgi:integrase